jgi:hypothetical protein
VFLKTETSGVKYPDKATMKKYLKEGNSKFIVRSIIFSAEINSENKFEQENKEGVYKEIYPP